MLEMIQKVFMRRQLKAKGLFRVVWKSEVTGIVYHHLADSFESAQIFRSAFGLGGDPLTYPQKVMD